MKLTEKMAYLKGLLDGMELDGSTKEGKAILQMSDVMEEMAVYIDDLQSQVDELTELCDLLDQDLGEVESDLYCDEDDDDDDDALYDDDDDEYPIGSVLPPDYDDFDYEDEDEEDFETPKYIVNCPGCEETLALSERRLEEGSMTCPYCGEQIEFNYDNIEAEYVLEDEADVDADEADSSDSEL